jgi:hypothetical protein
MCPRGKRAGEEVDRGIVAILWEAGRRCKGQIIVAVIYKVPLMEHCGSAIQPNSMA